MNEPKIDKRLAEIDEEIRLLSASISQTVADALTVKIDTLKDSLGKLDSFSIDWDTLGERIPDYGADFVSVRKEMTKQLSALKEELAHSAAGIAAAYQNGAAGTNGKLDEIIVSLSPISEQTSTSLADQGEMKKEFTARISSLKKAVDTVAGKVAEMDTSLGTIDTSVKSSSETLARSQMESAESILKELRTIRENGEILRRMMTTDEEKYLGGMITVIYNRTGEMEAEIAKILTNVRNWFVTLDKKQKQTVDDWTNRQEETKKILLYDIKAVSDTVSVISSNLATGNERKVGSEILSTSDRVEVVFERIPAIEKHIMDVSAKVERVSEEVMRMRWYVIAAASVSIIVLVVSFFT